MDDLEAHETLTALVTNLDPDAESAASRGFRCRRVDHLASGSRGRDNMRAMQRAFPPDRAPAFKVRRITGGGGVWNVEAIGDYGGEIYLVVVIFSSTTARSSVRLGTTPRRSRRRRGDHGGWSAWRIQRCQNSRRLHDLLTLASRRLKRSEVRRGPPLRRSGSRGRSGQPYGIASAPESGRRRPARRLAAIARVRRIAVFRRSRIGRDALDLAGDVIAPDLRQISVVRSPAAA